MKLCKEFKIQDIFLNNGKVNVSLFINLKVNDKNYNRDKLKFFIREIEYKLTKLQVPTDTLHSILSPFYAMFVMDNYHGCSAVGVLGNEKFFECYSLHSHVHELSCVGKDFMITPFLEGQHSNDEKWLLSIGNNKARLFKITPQNLEEVNVFGIFPKFKFDQSNLDKAGMHFNVSYGSNSDYLASIHHSLSEYFKEGSEGLILAGDRKLVSEFKSYNLQFKNCKYLPLNLDFESSVDIQLMLGSGLNLFDENDKSLNQLIKRLEEGKAQNKLEYIIDDCHRGKISDLYIKKNAYEWGEIDDTTGRYKIYPKRNKNSIDLLNNLAIKTVRKGGNVSLIPNNHALYHSETKVYALYKEK